VIAVDKLEPRKVSQELLTRHEFIRECHDYDRGGASARDTQGMMDDIFGDDQCDEHTKNS
jgi:hypothetical protein